jgi:predicted short-subunit dehydrogenase-like oxidoreductase (DUF2520 family)
MSVQRLGLVGAGRVGLAIARHAINRGCTLAWVVDTRQTLPDSIDQQIAECIHGGFDNITDESVDTCIIAVNDEAIESVAHALSQRGFAAPGTLVFHTSGYRNSDALKAIAGTGVLTGSIHPIASFSDTAGRTELTGIGCGIEGSDAFCERALSLASFFGWKGLRIDSERKVQYHAACVFAGNFLTVLAAHSETLLRTAAHSDTGASLHCLLPMMQRLLERLHDVPPAMALTGPAARGQHAIVNAHLAVLYEHFPDLAPVYRELSEAAARVAGREDG